jgi:hypothetical protein
MKRTGEATHDLEPQIDTALASYAGELRAAARVPSVESLLWKAALRERLAGAERAVRVANQLQRAILAAGGLGIAIVGALFRRPLFEFFASIRGGGEASPGSGTPLDLVLLTVALLSASALVVWLLEPPGEKS